MSTDPDSCCRRSHVGGTVVGIDEEVEHRPVVPDIDGLGESQRADVGHDECQPAGTDQINPFRDAGHERVERSRRDVNGDHLVAEVSERGDQR
jgi:hypothetical protein